MTLYIDYPATKAGRSAWSKHYGLNAYWKGKNYHQRAADAKYWHAITRAAMNAQNARKQPFDMPVHVSFFWDDRLDIDNHAAMGKMILDAMKGRVITDDSRRYVQSVSHCFWDGGKIKIVIFGGKP